MQWSADRNAGFSRAPYHRLFLPPVSEGPYSYHFVNVEAQQENPHSLLNFVRRLLGIRNRYAKVLGRGSLRLLPVENRRILAYEREYQGERVLVAANLSRYSQAFDLPLEGEVGLVPVELFSQSPFPPVEGRYRLALGPHGFILFTLRPKAEVERLYLPDWVATEEEVEAPQDLPVVSLSGGVEGLFIDTLADERARASFLSALGRVLGERSWLALRPERVELKDALRLQKAPPLYLTLLRLEGEEGSLEAFLPVALRPEGEGPGLFARVRGGGYLFELSQDPGFYDLLLRRLAQGFEGRSLRAHYRGRHPGPVPEALELLRPGLAAGEGVWLQVGLVQDGGLDRTERLLPRLDLPWVLKPVGGLYRARGQERRALALTGTLPSPRPQDAFAYALRLAGEGLARLQDHPVGEGALGLVAHALGELEALARLLGVRLALLHRALGEAEGEGEGVPLLNRGLEAFVEAGGEVFLLALGREGRGLPLQDLARLAYDLERALYLAAEEREGAEAWVDLAADFLEAALLQAYQEVNQGEVQAVGFPQAMLALAQEQALWKEGSGRKRVLERWRRKAGDQEVQ